MNPNETNKATPHSTHSVTVESAFSTLRTNNAFVLQQGGAIEELYQELLRAAKAHEQLNIRHEELSQLHAEVMYALEGESTHLFNPLNLPQAILAAKKFRNEYDERSRLITKLSGQFTAAQNEIIELRQTCLALREKSARAKTRRDNARRKRRKNPRKPVRRSLGEGKSS